MTTKPQPEALPPLPEPAAHRAECDEWVQYHDPHDPLPEQWDDKPDCIVPLFTADQMRAYATEHAARLHAECEALRASQADLRNDADKFGNALNEAGWAFVDAYRHHMGESEPPRLFNNCKSILRESILAFLDAAARAAKEQSNDDCR